MLAARTISVAWCRRYAARYLSFACVSQSQFSVASAVQDLNARQTFEDSDILPDHLQQFRSDSVQKIMRTARSKRLHIVISIQLLKALRVQVLLKRANLSDFQDCDGFKKLYMTFEVSCDRLEPSMLISGLRSLLVIGIDPTSSCIEKAERTIITNVSIFQMVELISCLHLLSKNLNTPLQRTTAAALAEEIAKRKFEVKTVSEALMLVQLIKFFKKEHIREIESSLCGIVDQMSVPDILKCIGYLAEQSIRAKSLLKKLSLCLQSKDKPNLKDTVNILFSILSLNYFDQMLLHHLTDGRSAEIAVVKQPSLISALLTVCGQLRWRHSGLLDACCQWMSNNLNICSSRELGSFILTLATLCYVPTDRSLLETVIGSLKSEDVGAKIWLDTVWASAILDSVNKDMLLKVVSSDFYRLLSESSGDLPVQSKVKLMHLMAVLKNKHPECIFSLDLFLDMEGIPKNEKSAMYKDTVLSVLKTFVPEGNYMARYLNTTMGITIDAEFIIGENEKPLPLSEYGLKAKPSVVTKSLPPGAKRIAMMIWLHKDLTLNESVLTGGNALAVKLLSMEGYTVVQVPYEVFIKNATAVTRAKYLWKLIQSHLDK